MSPLVIAGVFLGLFVAVQLGVLARLRAGCAAARRPPAPGASDGANPSPRARLTPPT